MFRFYASGRLVTVRLEAILCNSYRLSIIEPKGFEYFLIGGFHIPGFGYPMFFGYLYDNTLLLPKFFERLHSTVEHFLMQFELFERELPNIYKLCKTGFSEEDIRGYFYKKFNVMYAFD